MQRIADCMHQACNDKCLKSAFSGYLKQHPVSLVHVRINKTGKVCTFCWCEYLHFIKPKECTCGVPTKMWVGKQHLCANSLKPVCETCLREEGKSSLHPLGRSNMLCPVPAAWASSSAHHSEVLNCSLGVRTASWLKGADSATEES